MYYRILLELLKFKNRQMEMPTFTLMKDQAVTRAIQMFPPFLSRVEHAGRPFYAVYRRSNRVEHNGRPLKPRRNDGRPFEPRRTRRPFYAVRQSK